MPGLAVRAGVPFNARALQEGVWCPEAFPPSTAPTLGVLLLLMVLTSVSTSMASCHLRPKHCAGACPSPGLRDGGDLGSSGNLLLNFGPFQTPQPRRTQSELITARKVLPLEGRALWPFMADLWLFPKLMLILEGLEAPGFQTPWVSGLEWVGFDKREGWVPRWVEVYWERGGILFHLCVLGSQAWHWWGVGG